MASIGWQGISIAVIAVLIAGCGGLLLLTRKITHETLVQPMVVEPARHLRVVHPRGIRTIRPQENEHAPQDTADTGREVAVMVLMQAASEGLTRVRIIEELNPYECWCVPPHTDRAYFLSARECGSLCACVNENDPWISPRAELFPAE